VLHDLTKVYYDQNAAAYAGKTLIIRLDDLWNTFVVRLLPGSYVLDVGCGAGRDLKELARRGFRVLGVDYSAALADIARRDSGQEVWVADIRKCDFGEGQFDGIWAVASLLHIPRNEVVHVLTRLCRSLRSGGILLTSMKQGDGQEIDRDGRRFDLYQPGEWELILQTAGFDVEDRQKNTVLRQTAFEHAREVKWFVTICRKKRLATNQQT